MIGLRLASQRSCAPAPSGPKSRLRRFCANWRCSASPTSARSCAGGPMVLDSATLPPEVRLAVAEVSQSPNGALRVKMHDKHGPLVSIGKHLGMFVDRLQIRERKQISAEPMSAEEWKRQFVREARKA